MLLTGLLLCLEVSTGFWWANLREKDPLEDLGVDARKILKWILKKWSGGIHCVCLAQVRDRCGARVNAVTNTRFPRNAEKILTS
jgi:hypothetical protein